MAPPLRAPRTLQPLVAAVASACLSCAALLGPQVDGGCRNGVPEGAYRLQTSELVVEGGYVAGAREGMFRFRTPEGARLAEIPYVGGRRDGVIRVWYRPESSPGGRERRRLEAEVDGGIWDGASRYYYDDGRPRAEYIYVQGVLVGARAWNDEREPVAAEEAEALARADRVSDEQYLGVLEDLVRVNAPRCGR